MVGVWLLSGLARQAAALTGVTLFAVLGAVSLYLGLIGQSSCGCFGRIEVSPWWTLAADVFCAGALAVASFGRRADWQRPLTSTLCKYFAGFAAFGVVTVHRKLEISLKLPKTGHCVPKPLGK